MEGSSRSGKTYSSIDFLIWVASTHSNLTVNIIKETFNSFKTTLYRDFNKRLPQFGLSSPFSDRSNVSTFKLWDNQINLLSADNESVYSGVGSDMFWINESLDVSQQVHDQSEQRCQRFWWHDYNPKVTEHWVYDRLANRSDILFLKSTFLDNPMISEMEKRKILSYEPTHPDDRSLPPSKRRAHPTNIKEGTADDFMWNVYGLGLRSAPEGLVFQHVNFVEEMPAFENFYYGLDFGSVDPTVLVRGAKKDKDVYLEKVFYEPTDNPDRIIELLEANKITKSTTIWADSAAAGNISYMRRKGWRVMATSKPSGSVNFGIGLLKNFRINLVDCTEWRKEQTGYKYRVVNGIKLNEPLDMNNHLWDSARYIAMSNFI
jgi:PBSX family phage terminase large subunit